jgi:methylmalonyl-CoA mutase
MVKKEKLFDQFPPVTTQEWMKKIHSDLKGVDFNEKLVWKTNEGFDVLPFYRMEDIENLKYMETLPGEFPYLRGNKIYNNNWLIRQDIEVSDYAEANSKALSILMKGVDSLGFIIKDPESVNAENFNLLLKDILIEAIGISILCNGKAKEILEIITDITYLRGLDPANISGAIEADPIGRLIVNGKLCVSVESGFDYLASLTETASQFPNLRTMHLNASNFGNAGAGIVQELAFGIAMGSEYITQLTERGLSPSFAASKIRFSFGTGSNYFSEIAKLRAARLLWSLVQNGFGLNGKESVKMDIHSVTSKWNKTVYDQSVNMLRTQTEAMSAILGGADSLTVEPYDITFRQPDEFSERIARNQQLILKEEAYFDKVADPSAGSYYIENLTKLIADAAWKLFLEVEEEGGFLASLKSGFIQNMISDKATRRKEDIANGKEKLLGTNLFPDNNEKALLQVDHDRLFKTIDLESDLMINPVRLFRGSEEYEKMRLELEKEAEAKL